MNTSIKKPKPPEIALAPITPLFSLKRLAEFFDCCDRSGAPSTETILEWWHSGRIPPPDIKLSRKAIYWKPETILNFIEQGGMP